MPHHLLHTFTTAGYLPWLEVLLESAWLHSGERLDIRVDAMNLADGDVSRLRETYPHLDLRNQHLSDADIAAMIGIAEERLSAWKAEIEDARVTDRNFLYKVFISVNQRYRAMDEVIADAKAAGYDALIHADADLYVRADLTRSALAEEIMHHDLSLYVNDSLVALQHHRNVLGAFLCFNLRGNIDSFVNTWMAEIDRVPFLNRWKGYGQSALFYAINRAKDVDVFDLNAIADRFRPSRRFEEDAHIWFGSNTRSLSTRIKKKLRLRGTLSGGAESRRRCRQDLSRQEMPHGRNQ